MTYLICQVVVAGAAVAGCGRIARRAAKDRADMIEAEEFIAAIRDDS